MDNYSGFSYIGVGSYGRVYRACSKVSKKTVAIKIISKVGRSTKDIINFRQECKIQANLKHENIIEMFESFETKNEIVLVTEFSIIDLQRYLTKNGPINQDQAQLLTGQLISALYYLHSQRVLHRDLKPQNVLLNENLHAKLCDFGLARNMTMSTHVLTSIKGTPLYMAPELLAEKPYDYEADLWSLGCIIYEALVGQTPFYTTSIFHLVKLIRHEEVKWPSFIGSDCTSFLQGLLEKNPSLRITWAQILCHPFVEDNLNIPEDAKIKHSSTPNYTHQVEEKIRTHKKLTDSNDLSKNLALLSISDSNDKVQSLLSSGDSVNAVLQSDVENIETDAEELSKKIIIPFFDPLPSKSDKLKVAAETTNKHPGDANSVHDHPFFVSGNSNLVVLHMNDNFKSEIFESSKQISLKQKSGTKKTTASSYGSQKNTCGRIKDLEKRKLSQNLDNFSLRLGQSVDDDSIKKIGDSICDKKKIKTLSSLDEKVNSLENTPPCLLPGWDSCDESQSPPIENDEWLAFLKRTMQEILDGDFDSLKEQNLVSIIVAPLRNTRASSEVIANVAKLLSFPLVLVRPPTALDAIINIYIDVKLVPNLMYASKLLTSAKNLGDSASTPLKSSINRNIKCLKDLTSYETTTISNLFELVCHLVHINERFLLQFCDAVAILAADELLINLLTHDFKNSDANRISNNIIALFCCILRELPENAEIVENIIFNPKLNLILLVKNGTDSILKSRMCMLFRLLGRFSLVGLQNVWKPSIREAFEKLLYDPNDNIQMDAANTLAELKHFSFYF